MKSVIINRPLGIYGEGCGKGSYEEAAEDRNMLERESSEISLDLLREDRVETSSNKNIFPIKISLVYKIEIKPKLSRCVPPLPSEEDARDPEVWSKFEGRGREARGWRVIRRIRDRRNETNEEHVGGTIRGELGDSNGSGIIRSQDREGERGG